MSGDWTSGSMVALVTPFKDGEGDDPEDDEVWDALQSNSSRGSRPGKRDRSPEPPAKEKAAATRKRSKR